MKMRTKILTALLFAGIFAFTHGGKATERAAFQITAPSQAALDYSLTLAISHLNVAEEDARFVRLAQK